MTRPCGVLRKTPCDLRLRRHLLCANQRREIVDDQHHAVGPLGAAQRRRHRRQLQLAIVARQRNLQRGGSVLPVPAVRSKRTERLEILAREYIGRGLSHCGRVRGPAAASLRC